MLDDFIIMNNIATDDEIRLVAAINGYNEQTMWDIIYARVGLRNYEQCLANELLCTEELCAYYDVEIHLDIRKYNAADLDTIYLFTRFFKDSYGATYFEIAPYRLIRDDGNAWSIISDYIDWCEEKKHENNIDNFIYYVHNIA